MAEKNDNKKFNPFEKKSGGGEGKSTSDQSSETVDDLGQDIEMPEETEFPETETVVEEENKDGKNLFDKIKDADHDKDGEKMDAEKKDLFGEDNPKNNPIDDGGEGDGEGGDSSENKEEADEPKEADTGMTDEFAQFTAKWLVDVYSQTFCMFLKNYSKIDKKTVYEAILSGHLDERFLKHIETANAKVDKEITFTEEQKKFIVEPLTRFVKVNKVKVPSGLQLLIGLGVVSGAVFMTANDLRKDNEYLLNRIIQESQKIREAIRRKRDGIDEEHLNMQDENSENQESTQGEEESSEQENSGETTDYQDNN
jgi:hypothetical protein